MAKFLNLVPWAGLYFCHLPNQVIDLDDDVADAREKAGLGRVVKDKSKAKAADPAPDPVLVTDPAPSPKVSSKA